MPSTHLSLNYHLIFSTKNRTQLITDFYRDKLHSYLGGIIRNIGGIPDTIGGTANHVHLLVGLKATHRIDYVLRDIKSGSSEWVHEQEGTHQFSWQDGYGAFSVSSSALPQVRKYILNQMEHHRKKTFEEEYREFLIKSGTKFDERYLW
jgi:REP element-mobilizing transposase RayT